MTPEDIPDYLKLIGKQIENRVSNALGDSDASKKNAKSDDDTGGRVRMNANGFAEFEPDWDELDKKADRIVAGYSVVSAAGNILPLPFDVLMVTATFSKMTTELSGVYQVIVSAKRARQIGWAIATTTGSILGLTYAASSLVKYIPFGYAVSVAVQAPLIGAVCWAAGDALKQYFKACRQGVEPDIAALRVAFARTLHIRLSAVKSGASKMGVTLPSPVEPTATASAAPKAAAPQSAINEVLEQIAVLHELQRSGAITKDDYDKKKIELLKRI